MSSSSTINAMKAGGVGSFQVGQEAADEAATRQPMEIPHNTVFRSDSSGNVTAEQSYGKSHPGDAPTAGAIALDPSVLDSATTLTGRRIGRSEITPDSLIRTAFGQQKVSSLLAAGMLVKSASGEITVPFSVAGSPAKAPAAPQQTLRKDAMIQPDRNPFDDIEAGRQPAAAPQPVSLAIEQEVNAIINTTTLGDQMSALHQFSTNGEVSNSTVNKLAQQCGKSVEEVRATLGDFAAAMTQQASSAVSALGLDFADFSDWARSSQPDALADAVKQHGMQRTTAGYQALAQKYFETLDLRQPDVVMEAAEAAGLRPRKVGQRIVVNIKGRGEMLFAVAARFGLISPGR